MHISSYNAFFIADSAQAGDIRENKIKHAVFGSTALTEVKVNFDFPKSWFKELKRCSNLVDKSDDHFFKIGTRNITLWSKICDMEIGAVSGLVKGIYLFSYVLGLPLVDWAIGYMRDDQEAQIHFWEGFGAAKSELSRDKSARDNIKAVEKFIKTFDYHNHTMRNYQWDEENSKPSPSTGLSFKV